MNKKSSDIPDEYSPAPASSRRWLVFFVTLLITSAIALFAVFSREPVYRAIASVMASSQPAGVERPTPSGLANPADLLLSHEVLKLLGEQADGVTQTAALTTSQLSSMLKVVSVPGTDLLELRAEGSDAFLLQQLVNRWPEAYETWRRQAFDPTTREQIAVAEAELALLKEKTDTAEATLREFQEANDIAALRQQSQAVAGNRKQLERQLSNAQRDLEKTEQHKAKQQNAIIAGETVAPRDQKRAIDSMRRDLERMQARLDDFLEQYTPAFVELDPRVRELPAEIEAKQREIDEAVRNGQAAVLADADRKIAAAQTNVDDIERQLDALDGSTGEVDNASRQLQVLESELARLQAAQSDKNAELSRLRGDREQLSPPVQLVSRAEAPTQPIHPKYERDAMFAIAIALGLAFLASWIAEYLGSRRKPARPMPVHSGTAAQDPLVPMAEAVTSGEAAAVSSGNLALSSRELAGTELRALLAGCDATVTGYAALLLSGVSPYELPLLHAACFEASQRRLTIPGAGARQFEVNDKTWSLFEALIGDMDQARMPLTVAQLDEKLKSAATQAALSQPQDITALTLWHTYVVFLVRQGVSAADLQARVGMVPPSMLDAIMHLAPEGTQKSSEEIEFTYPLLV